jgi:hypothetical protein
MAVPLLDFLTGRAKAALPFLVASAEKGRTAAQAIAELAPLNLTFRRQAMLDVYAALTSAPTPTRIERLIGPDVPIPQNLHTTSPAPLGTNYQYVVSFESLVTENPDYLTVVSDVPLSIADIRELGAELANDELYKDLDLGFVEASDVTVSRALVDNRVPPS